MAVIKLKSSDGEVFEVDLKVARRMATIRSMLEDVGPQENDEDNEPIPLPKVTGAVFKMVIEWVQHHQDDPPVDEDDEDYEPVKPTDWDREFLKIDSELFREVILAANYLNIISLLDVSCKILADMIRGKTKEEILKICKLEDTQADEIKENEAPNKETTAITTRTRSKSAGAAAEKRKLDDNPLPATQRSLRSQKRMKI